MGKKISWSTHAAVGVIGRGGGLHRGSIKLGRKSKTTPWETNYFFVVCGKNCLLIFLSVTPKKKTLVRVYKLYTTLPQLGLRFNFHKQFFFQVECFH